MMCWDRQITIIPKPINPAELVSFLTGPEITLPLSARIGQAQKPDL